jgi:hypothetical protein
MPSVSSAVVRASFAEGSCPSVMLFRHAFPSCFSEIERVLSDSGNSPQIRLFHSVPRDDNRRGQKNITKKGTTIPAMEIKSLSNVLARVFAPDPTRYCLGS